jgi:hypothetical protein
MIFSVTGSCPRCGAPIFAVSAREPNGFRDGQVILTLNDAESKPVAHFTCDCRLTLSKPLPDLTGLEPESTDLEDRRWLSRHRPQKEPASVERAD